MKIAIDISPIRGKHQFRGIGIYTKLLIQALKRVDPENEYILTTKPRLSNIDLIHYPFFDLFFLTLPFIKLKPTVVTIHDTIPLIYKEAYPPGLRGKWKFKLQVRSLRGVKAIITDSDCSKRDVIRYLKVPEDKVNRVYLAANPQVKFQTYPLQKKMREQYNLNKPYLLYVGDINYNKNIEGLVRAFELFSKDFDLVLVSRALLKEIPEAMVIRKLIDTLKLNEAIKIIGDLPDEPQKLASLYSGAYWYIQPSFYEGFGLPVLEAMQCQVPVIASVGGSLTEITGDAALPFDPENQGELHRVIYKAINMTKGERNILMQKGLAQANKYSWEKTALETSAVYRKILG